MAYLEIPTFPETAAYQETVTLDGTEYTIIIGYNQRADAYFFGIQDDTGADIIRGRKLVPGIPLLRNLAADIRPAGEMVAVDLEDTDTSARLGELGTRVKLYYIEEADVEAIR